MLSEEVNGNDPEARQRMRDVFGPNQVDFTVRQAIQSCWWALPDDARNVDELEKQIRRLVDRALRDVREDAAAFGLGNVGG